MTEPQHPAFDWHTGPLAEGLRCYRSQQFWHAHEHWEIVWLTLAEPERSFLRALIQLSAAFHHLQRNNRTGALALLAKALRRIDDSPPVFCGIDAALLRTQAKDWHAALVNDSQLPASIPVFSIIEA